MNHLLHHVDLITRQRDNSRLEAQLVAAAHAMADAEVVRLYKLFQPDERALVALAAEHGQGGLHQYDDGISAPEVMEPIADHPHFAVCMERKPSAPERLLSKAGWLHVFPVHGRKSDLSGFLSLLRREPLSDAEMAVLDAIVTVFENCHDLLSYSQSDTLTGLLNRKTFDEHLFKILSRHNPQCTSSNSASAERRHVITANGEHWLGVMDIDHFKRINDGFGHMIGDEVLLMLANRMRAQFRTHDKLFRFGGEEFVVLLTPTGSEQAHCTFERFRQAMEKQEFPQVGRVTISIGFARFGVGSAASDVLGNADRALYWAKEHGRNQVCSYEQLVARGELHAQTEMNAEVDFF
jgi:diguanylate cyclase (GGDEF)-like protein